MRKSNGHNARLKQQRLERQKMLRIMARTMSQVDIAKHFGITPQRVSQLMRMQK